MQHVYSKFASVDLLQTTKEDTRAGHVFSTLLFAIMEVIIKEDGIFAAFYSNQLDPELKKDGSEAKEIRPR